jgi:outer membrane protein assembly factor BamB
VLESANSSANVTIIDRVSLAKLQGITVQTVPTGLFHDDNDVWITSSDYTTGHLYRYDAQTHAFNGEYVLPQKNIAMWKPTTVTGDDRLWFTAGAPPLLFAPGFVLDLTNITGSSTERTPGLFALDAETGQWSEGYDLLPASLLPLVDPPFLWFLTTRTPVFGREADMNDGTIYAVDTRNGQFYGSWIPCLNSTAPMIAGAFVWVGCYPPVRDLWLFDRTTPEVRYKYRDLGSRPWQPLTVGNRIWVTFRDTNNAAVFDSSTGELIGKFVVGRNPGPPFELHNGVWTFNAGDGVLQRLGLSEQQDFLTRAVSAEKE